MRHLCMALALLAGASLAVTAQAGGDPMKGEEKAKQCASCHGPRGNADNPQYPRLANQYRDYLVHALRAYKSGARANAIMNGMAQGLSEQDIEDLAAFYARQPVGVYQLKER